MDTHVVLESGQVIPSQSGALKQKVARRMERAALDESRQALVRNNIGLVYVHMKHYVARHRVPWTQREWEDLVQEGCLGLIRAAQDFNPQGRIPFAAFALPRIHTAIRRVMVQRFGSGTAFAGGEAAAKRSLFGVSQRPDWSPRKPRRNSGDENPLDALGDWRGSNKDTLGIRLREKYERAVRRAVACVTQRDDSKQADAELVRVLATDRHLVPDEHGRRSFRDISRRLNAPYTRVIQCDQKLRVEIRRCLENDPEFTELQRRSQIEPRGVDAPAGERLDRELARLSAAELLQRLLHSPGGQREKTMTRLFEVAGPSLFEAIHLAIESLPIEAREDLLGESSPVCPESHPSGNATEVRALAGVE